MNIDIGKDIRVSDLSKQYNAVVLCTGMSDSKRNWLGFPGCYGADEIFGWYNKNPLALDFRQDFSKIEHLIILGNGNVALDMARIFAKKPHHFADGTIDCNVMSALQRSKIREITILGRRELINVKLKLI